MRGYNWGPDVNWPRQKGGGALPAGVGVFNLSQKVTYPQVLKLDEEGPEWGKFKKKRSITV